MERDAFRPGRKLVVGSSVLALAALTTLTPTAFSAERVVLGEFFTWVDCPSCSLAEPVVDNMVDVYGVGGNGTLAVFTCHLWDGYQSAWGAARAQTFYGPIFLGTPTLFLDGIHDPWPIDTFVSTFLARQSVPTTVTVSIFAEENIPHRYDITVEVCLEAGADPVDLRIYTVVAEDHYPINDPDSGLIHARNFARGVAPTTDISLLPGECAEVHSLLAALPVTVQDNIRLVAWAQEPNNTWPADVYQAAVDDYPFEPPVNPCPWDCGNDDGEVGINDFLAMLADWGSPGPCDLDGNDVIDVVDFLDLLANWGPCP
jgi:hypothetical protein